MTKEELRNYYKVINIDKVNEDITKIDLYHEEGDNNRHVRLLFAYNKLYYTGDMGTYVFGNFVHNIKTFFKGSEINPGYWSEKCEASSQPIIDTDIDYDKFKDSLYEYLKEYYPEECFTDNNLDEYKEDVCEIIENHIYRYEPNEIRVWDLLDNLLSDLELKYDSEDVYTIIKIAKEYSSRYLYACEVIQWVENEVLED